MGPWGRFVENVSAKLAFFPPQPSTYTVEAHSDNGELYIQPALPDYPKVGLFRSCSLLHAGQVSQILMYKALWLKVVSYRPLADQVLSSKTTRLTTKNGEQIVACFIPYSNRGQPAQMTVLYSHGEHWLRTRQHGSAHGMAGTRLVQRCPSWSEEVGRLHEAQCLWRRPGSTAQAPAMRRTSAKEPWSQAVMRAPVPACLLCCAGNAVDLGQMLPVYKDLSKLLKVNVMGWVMVLMALVGVAVQVQRCGAS